MISTEGVGISGLFASQGLDHVECLIITSPKADAFQAKCSNAPMIWHRMAKVEPWLEGIYSYDR